MLGRRAGPASLAPRMTITVDLSATPKPPRPAATVILLRAGAGGQPAAIFMLRRSARSPFMPDALVFPGGAVAFPGRLG